jgi:HD-GYP domain-containing protein (c-di-GMP phosphodiesterase class II)
MALGIDAALNMVEKNQGTLFDPKAVQACLKIFREEKYTFIKQNA